MLNRIIILVVLLVGVLEAKEDVVAVYLHQLKTTLTYKQKEVLVSSYLAGKPFGFEYTLTAIAWRESVFGKFKVNLADGRKGSFGIYHCLLDSALKRLGRRGSWADSRVAEKLIFDRKFAQRMAIAELQYWDRYWTGKGVSRVWSHVVGSYNAGFHSYKCEQGLDYVEDIRYRIKALKIYLRNTNLDY